VQIFTGSVGDRPTLFIEIIQRLGCMKLEYAAAAADEGSGTEGSPPVATLVQEPGCGGFGKGNVAELYSCMEQYDARLARTASDIASGPRDGGAGDTIIIAEGGPSSGSSGTIGGG
jgi:hypothetical protein